MVAESLALSALNKSCNPGLTSWASELYATSRSMKIPGQYLYDQISAPTQHRHPRPEEGWLFRSENFLEMAQWC